MPETEAGPIIIRFGHCELFTSRRELVMDGVPVPLGNRAFNILQVLLGAGGDLVTKDEILSRVWPGIIVEENTLQSQITRVRRALGRDRGFLKTVSGHGYRFVAKVTSAGEECEGTAKAATIQEALAPERRPLKEALDLERRHEIDDGRPPAAIKLLTFAQYLHDLRDVAECALAIDDVLRYIFRQNIRQCALELVGRQQK